MTDHEKPVRINFPMKMPFEDRLLEAMLANPGRTVEEYARCLGISARAALVAAMSLQAKGNITLD